MSSIRDRAQILEDIADTAEQICYDATPAEECLPPHPSYEVDGNLIRKLGSLITELMVTEEVA